MADLRVHKVTALPVPAEANAIYFVEIAPDKFDIYVTDSAANPHSLNQTAAGCCTETKIITDNEENLTPDSKNIIDSIDPTILILPPGSIVGQTIEIIGVNTGSWRVNQNASQVIFFNDKMTTMGVGGYITSSSGYDYIKMVAVTNNNHWRIVSASSECINLF